MPTVAKNLRTNTFTAASASAGPFSLGFRLFDDDTIKVYVNGTLTTDYTLISTYSGGYDDSATITFDTALTIGDVVVIDSALVPARADDLLNGVDLTTKLNVELARVWSVLADHRRDIGRSVRGFDQISPLGSLVSGDYAELLVALQAAPYASRASFLAATIPALVTLSSFIHDGIVCQVQRDSTGAIVQDDGTKWSAVAPVYVQHYGVTCEAVDTDATTDFTTEIQTAFDSTNGDLIFTGWVLITDEVSLGTGCRPTVRDGRQNGGLRMGTGFNLSANYVLNMSGADGSHIGKFGMSFDQSAASTSGLRADLVAYPPAVGLTGIRPTIDALRINAGYDGLSGIANCGGARFGILELGCFNDAMAIDGALDFVHSDSIEVWPFGFGADANLTGIFYDGTGYALDLGQCDGWVCDKFSAFRKKVQIDRGSAAILPYNFSTMQFDGDGARLEVVSGRIRIGQLYSTKSASPTDPTIDITGGITTIGQVSMAGGEAVCIDVTGGELSVNGGEIYNSGLGKIGGQVSAGTLCLTNVRFNWPAGTRTEKFVKQSSTGILVMQGCSPVILTAQDLVSVGADVSGNFVDIESLNPHRLILPSTSLVNGIYRKPRQISTGTLIAATMGDLNSLTTSIRWKHDGEFLHFEIRMNVTPTFSTASGNLSIDVPDFPILVQAAEMAIAQWEGFTFTGGRDKLLLRFTTSQSITIYEVGNGLSEHTCDTASITSGTPVVIRTTGSVAIR